METKKIDLGKLIDPLPCKWRIQSAKNGWAICVPYIDSRDVQARLDEVCGAHNWQSKHKDVGGSLYCEIGIRIDGEWIWKSDVGTKSNIESEKGAASDSFKRAAVQWGIGRFLYQMNPAKLKTTKYKDKEYPFIPASLTKDNQDKIIWDGDALSKYINYTIEEQQKKAA